MEGTEYRFAEREGGLTKNTTFRNISVYLEKLYQQFAISLRSLEQPGNEEKIRSDRQTTRGRSTRSRAVFECSDLRAAPTRSAGQCQMLDCAPLSSAPPTIGRTRSGIFALCPRRRDPRSPRWKYAALRDRVPSRCWRRTVQTAICRFARKYITARSLRDSPARIQRNRVW